MCMVPGSQLFVRSDGSDSVDGILPDLAITKVTPAQHMNYGGDNSYNGSGYLSMFRYEPTSKSPVYFGERMFLIPAAARAILALTGQYIHFMFISLAAAALVNLDEGNVRQLPTSGRAPTLFNTDGCRPPARKTEDGEVIEYANRYCNESLLSGQWPMGTKVITERRSSSILLRLLIQGASLDTVCNTTETFWPCHPPPPPPGGSGGFGGGSAIAT